MYLPPFFGEMVNTPVSPVTAPLTCALSFGLSNTAVAPTRVSPERISVTLPVTVFFCAQALVGHISIANIAMGKSKSFLVI